MEASAPSPSQGSFFLDDINLCQVDKNPTSAFNNNHHHPGSTSNNNTCLDDNGTVQVTVKINRIIISSRRS